MRNHHKGKPLTDGLKTTIVPYSLRLQEECPKIQVNWSFSADVSDALFLSPVGGFLPICVHCYCLKPQHASIAHSLKSPRSRKSGIITVFYSARLPEQRSVQSTKSTVNTEKIVMFILWIHKLSSTTK